MAVARFRFYEELNDFLPPAQRKRPLEIPFEPPVPVGHLIERCGVPHTEVEVILVNGESVALDHRLSSGDRVSVYPVFEALDVRPLLRLRPLPLRDTRFLADAHLGRLARYLRMLGFDTRYANDPGDRVLVKRCVDEQRVLLTRDRALLMHRLLTHGCYIQSTRPRRQLEQVVRRLDLYRGFRPFSRCTLCNGLLEPVAREEVAERLPPRVRQSFDRFWHCTDCDHLYWKGSHYRYMEQLVEALLRASA